MAPTFTLPEDSRFPLGWASDQGGPTHPFSPIALPEPYGSVVSSTTATQTTCDVLPYAVVTIEFLPRYHAFGVLRRMKLRTEDISVIPERGLGGHPPSPSFRLGICPPSATIALRRSQLHRVSFNIIGRGTVPLPSERRGIFRSMPAPVSRIRHGSFPGFILFVITIRVATDPT